ncbi:MFS transporter [Corynebacterium sp.]|uniref:MFS transporter n=1 Tax=Corynebacterium sp. TaxID=1720 RepID=UPI0026DCA480|nr:MFS transporter [Corynebacterium sp.]
MTAEPARPPLRRPIGVALMFATNGLTIASLLPWYPTLKAQWSLSDLVYGLVVTGIGVGALLALAVPAWAERTFGARATMVAGTTVTALLLPVAVTAPGPAPFLLVLLALGAMDIVVDVSQNVAAVRVQDRWGSSIMNSLHACWSLGAVAGGAVGTAAAVRGADPVVHLVVVAVVLVAMVVVAAWMMGPVGRGTAEPVPEAGGDGTESTGRDAVPEGKDDGADGAGATRAAGPPRARTLLLVAPVALVAMTGALSEEVPMSWAAVSAVELAAVPVTASGVAFTVFIAFHMFARFLGDPLTDRLGTVAVARMGGLFVVAGGACVVLAHGPWPLVAGYALVGWGCATLVPAAYAASASVPGVAEGTGLTIVSWLLRISVIVASPAIGAVSDATSLRVALGVLVIAGAVAAAGASALAPRGTAGEPAGSA